jgi:hypothetical protein
MAAKITADATGTKVTIGTAAEDALQIDATAKIIKALAPYLLKGDIAAQSLTPNGYVKLASGLIIQWVFTTSTIFTDTPIGVAWPIPFPTACLFSTYSLQGASVDGKIYIARSNNSTPTAAQAIMSSITLQDISGMFLGIGY